MANTTDPLAVVVHGTNPQFLVEKILREKIREAPFWKEHCFALNAETLVDRAVLLDHVGGTYGGNRKPAKFICLILKMLQIQPDKDIIIEYIMNEDYKYAVMRERLTCTITDVCAAGIYEFWEPSTCVLSGRRWRFTSIWNRC